MSTKFCLPSSSSISSGNNSGNESHSMYSLAMLDNPVSIGAATATAAAAQQAAAATSSSTTAAPRFVHGLQTYVGGLEMSVSGPSGGKSRRNDVKEEEEEEEEAEQDGVILVDRSRISSQYDERQTAAYGTRRCQKDTGDREEDREEADEQQHASEGGDGAAAHQRKLASWLQQELKLAKRRADIELYRAFRRAGAALNSSSHNSSDMNDDDRSTTTVAMPAAGRRRQRHQQGNVNGVVPAVSPGWHVPETGMQDSFSQPWSAEEAEQRQQESLAFTSTNTDRHTGEGEGRRNQGALVPLRTLLKDDAGYLPLLSFPGGRIPEALKPRLRERLGLKPLETILKEVSVSESTAKSCAHSVAVDSDTCFPRCITQTQKRASRRLHEKMPERIDDHRLRPLQEASGRHSAAARQRRRYQAAPQSDDWSPQLKTMRTSQ